MTYSQDDHGTHVAGTIHMMAPDAEIHDYRVFGKDGFEIDDAIATSIYESCFDGCDIINMSLGGRWPSSTIRSAVQYAHSRGVIVVCAAGNEGDANPLTNERRYVYLFVIITYYATTIGWVFCFSLHPSCTSMFEFIS
mmetsp:Transcript_17162/g.25633  ORF Transcript_17162/g.25633 Transcript_17162/m.25633 type:complete len:138 (-) Transcript_17162:223-636(-)